MEEMPWSPAGFSSWLVLPLARHEASESFEKCMNCILGLPLSLCGLLSSIEVK